MATGADKGVYLEHYLKLGLNWKTFDDQTFDFCQGITLHHLPGHTDGELKHCCGLGELSSVMCSFLKKDMMFP